MKKIIIELIENDEDIELALKFMRDEIENHWGYKKDIDYTINVDDVD